MHPLKECFPVWITSGLKNSFVAQNNNFRIIVPGIAKKEMVTQN
jgi:hypothetical protein